MYKAVKDDETARFLTDRELARKERISIREEGRMEGMAQGIKKGMTKGVEQGKKQLALRLINNGVDLALVKQTLDSDLPDDEFIESLRNN
ncbi:hypothetical protein ACLGL1_06945 [Peptococcus simiae]|uniref:hypothetical protein n=1 Tax=Peptococcus simiae TaxID=1643805 RepID=UPI00397FA354